MPINPVNTGTAPDNGTGDALRIAFQKINSNESYLKTYADNLIQGLKWKNKVDAATTGNITLVGEQTIDGVATSASRVLVKDQTDKTENGIYLTDTVSWVRTTDADAGGELVNATVSVVGGTTNANTNWTCNASSITLGTTDIDWVEFVGADGVDQSTFDAAIQLINDEIDALETRVQALEDANGVTVKEHQVNGVRVDNTNVSGTYNIDWDAGSVFNITMTGNTTFAFLNLPTDTNTRVITMYLTGNFTPTFPTEATEESGDTYDGTINNRVTIDCVNGNQGTEKIFFHIKNL